MRLRFAIAGFVIAVFGAGGCGKEAKEASPELPVGKTANGTPASPAAPAVITTVELDKVGKAAKPYRIALVVKTRNNPFFDPMIKAFEEEGKALGAVTDVEAPPQETDVEQQVAMVETLAAKGEDAILIAPADSKAVVPALQKAAAKGILIINIDNRVDAPTARSAGLVMGGYVGADNEAGGKLAGQALVAALHGKGKVAILEGIRGADNAEARKRGFEAAAAGKLDVVSRETANWQTQEAYSKFQSIMAVHKDLAGVFCANDNMALGALKAISESGKKGKVIVAGYDNIKDVQPYLQRGEMYATVEQHPELMGKYGALMAVGVLNGSVSRGMDNLVPLELIRGR